MFDSIRHLDSEGAEFWNARELADVLDYTWEGFVRVIAKSEISVSQVGQSVDDHFRHVSKMVMLGSGSERAIDDVELTRYACYVVAQNGNAAKKPAIAGAQSYFAMQTRRQELSDERDEDMKRLIARHEFTESDKRLSSTVMEKGVNGEGLGRLKSSGDKVMFGGKTTAQMKKQYGIIQRKTALANRMPNVVLAAKSLANEMTATNLERYSIDGFPSIKGENDGNNAKVRNALNESGIVPEELPPAEDTDIIRNRVSIDDKRRA
ncbi:MAG: DNA damage-inducible protein D, partial [Candidatus Saccharimonadales bacterium]